MDGSTWSLVHSTKTQRTGRLVNSQRWYYRQQNVCAMVRCGVAQSFYLRPSLVSWDRTRLRNRTTAQTHTLVAMRHDNPLKLNVANNVR
jgi:hypothetical protein